jgi:hypothetical protein
VRSDKETPEAACWPLPVPVEDVVTIEALSGSTWNWKELSL